MESFWYLFSGQFGRNEYVGCVQERHLIPTLWRRRWCIAEAREHGPKWRNAFGAVVVLDLDMSSFILTVFQLVASLFFMVNG